MVGSLHPGLLTMWVATGTGAPAPPISASPRSSEGPPHLTQLPTPVLPSELPAASLQSKSTVVIFFFFFFFYFINIIYKDWSSKKAEMRRLGRGGSWLHSCPLGVGLGDPPHLSLLLYLPRNPNPVGAHIPLSTCNTQGDWSRRNRVT